MAPKLRVNQPRIAACKGCGGGGSGIIRDNARRMPRHESMFTHDRANVMSDYANRVQRHAAVSGAGCRLTNGKLCNIIIAVYIFNGQVTDTIIKQRPDFTMN